MKTLIGNVKGPQGDKGDRGAKGDKGATGSRGSRWTEGTAITGTSTTPTVFSSSGISDALENDQYLNTTTGNVYRCTTGGSADVAKWIYACNIKGLKGDPGTKGDKGDKGERGEKGDTGETGPKGDTPTVADDMTVAFTQAASRANITTGEKMNTIMGKIKKWFSDMTAAAFAQVITSNADLMALTKSGYLVDALAVKDQFTEINGKLPKVVSQIHTVTTSDVGTIFIYDIPAGTYLYATCSDTNLWVRTYYTENYLVLGVANYNNVNIANQEVTIETFWLVNNV